MIEKVKGLSICGRCFSKKTNLTFFPNYNDRIAIVYGKNGSGKSTISDGFSQIASGEDTEPQDDSTQDNGSGDGSDNSTTEEDGGITDTGAGTAQNGTDMSETQKTEVE